MNPNFVFRNLYKEKMQHNSPHQWHQLCKRIKYLLQYHNYRKQDEIREERSLGLWDQEPDYYYKDKSRRSYKDLVWFSLCRFPHRFCWFCVIRWIKTVRVICWEFYTDNTAPKIGGLFMSCRSRSDCLSVTPWRFGQTILRVGCLRSIAGLLPRAMLGVFRLGAHFICGSDNNGGA